jgi:signal transduction histidine kinase
VAQTRLDLLTEDVDSPHADAIDRSLERMDDIVSDVLRLAQEGRVVRDPEVVDAGAVIEEAWGTVDTEGATLDHEGGACRLRADPGRVRTLLENLFANAVEHGDDPTVRVGTLDNGDGFYVADDGPGIPDDEREEVFRYGYSLSAGSGLGLAIVEAVADAHGWTVTAGESESGGARFEFRGVDLI